jgi:long-chain acyl-CoA synthetase
MAHGSGAAICRGVPSLLEDLQLVRPTVLFAVPTLYKRVFDGVNNLIENATPLRKGLMKKAMSVGHKRTEANRGTGPSLGMLDKIQLKVLDGLVLSKIRDRFGGNLRHGFVAGAACPREVIDFMDDVGIPICEGYGLTETSPIITLNTPYRRQVGSVGQTLNDVHVVILSEDGKRNLGPGEEGEICCYGPNVMRGYYNKREETAEVISLAPDGKSRL